MLSARAIHPNDKVLKARALEFIRLEARGGLFERPAKLLNDAMQSGQAIVVEAGERIVATALMFDYTGEMRHYFELGTHLVAKDHEGRGIQVALTRIQLAQACLDLESLEISPIFAVMENNSPSAHNAETRVKFKRWALPDELAGLRERRGVSLTAEKVVYAADDEAVEDAFSSLRVDVTDNVLTTHKGEYIRLEFPWFERLLKAGPY
jgi:hypothetical protein